MDIRGYAVLISREYSDFPLGMEKKEDNNK